jgi:hypothetical protein
MSTYLGKQSYSANSFDVNIWRAVHGDGHRPLTGIQNILITVDSGTQFTIKQGTAFSIYTTDSFTSPATPDTQNNSYPNSTSITYFNPFVIAQPSDFQVTIGVTSGFSSTNATYYLYASSSDDSGDSTRGEGEYAATTNAPTWSDEKQGWYHATDGKALARYVVASGSIEQFLVYDGITNERGYIQHGGLVVSATDDIVISGLIADIDGKIIRYLQSVTMDFNGQAAGWYVPYIDETSGAVSFQAIASFSSGASGNQLDMYTTYDTARRYCENGSKRALAVVYFDGTNFDYVFQIDNVPKTKISCSSNTGQTLFTGSYYRFNFEDIEYDLNSEITNGANWRFTPKTNKTVNIDFRVTVISGSGSNDNEIFHAFLYDDTSNILSLYEDILITSQSRIQWKGSVTFNALTTNELNINVRQACGSARTTYNSNNYNWIKINEL